MQEDPPVAWSVPVLVAGRYQVLRVLGTGAQASVFLARDLATDELRALKLADPGLHEASRRDEWHARFLREARLMSRLSHPSVLRVHEVLTVDTAPVIVTEMAEGGSLAAWMNRNGNLPPARAVEIAIQCASALTHAHGHGVLHRDVKPANVLVRADGTVALADFGIAWWDEEGTITRDDTVIGTLPFLAPELRAGARPPTTAADVYGIGVLVHVLCTGRRESDLYRCSDERERLAGLPGPLADVVACCCRFEPSERPADMEEVHRRLTEAYAACAAVAPDAPSLTDGVAPLPGVASEQEAELIEALRVRLANVDGGGMLEESATEMYTPHDVAPPEEVVVEVPLEVLRVEPAAWGRTWDPPAPLEPVAVAPPEVWAPPKPPRVRRPRPPLPMWPAVLSVIVLAVSGAVGLGLVAARIADRAQAYAEARDELVRAVLEEQALVDHVAYAGTARRALARLDPEAPSAALGPAREIAERLVRQRDVLTREHPGDAASVLRVEAALRSWKAAEAACTWRCD